MAHDVGVSLTGRQCVMLDFAAGRVAGFGGWMDEIALRHAHELVGLLGAGGLSGVELLDRLLDRIDRPGAAVNAVVTLSTSPNDVAHEVWFRMLRR